MSGLRTVATLIVGSGLWQAGCVPRDAGYEDVRELTAARLGSELAADTSETPAAPSEEVQRLLSQPLTPPTAAKIAVLNSPLLQAELAKVGVARAELVNALRLPNPHVGASLRYGQEDAPEVDVDVMISLSELLFLSSRNRAASTDLEAAALEVTKNVVGLAFDARRRLFDHQAALAQCELRTSVVQAFGAAAELAQRLFDAGNITQLKLASERAMYEQARIELARAETDVASTREQLNTVLGLWGEQGARWTTEPRLPEPEPTQELVAQLEQRSVERSLDIEFSRRRYEAAAQRGNLARVEGWFPELRAGAGAERTEAGWAFGPSAEISVPLFYQGQGQVARAQAQMQQYQAHARQAAIQVRARARDNALRLATASQMVDHYQRTILPLREQVVQQAQLQYNAMNAGVFELLQAKRDQVTAGQTYVDILREYWTLRSNVEQLLAGSLPDGNAAGGSTPAPTAMAESSGGH